MSIYGATKLIHHADKFKILSNGGHIAPSQIHFIISDLCNQNCGFCAYRMDGYTSNQLFHVLREDGSKNNNPNRQIPTEKIIEILDDAARLGVKAIQFTGGGEPTVHPYHALVMKHAVQRGLEIALVSNGVNWKDETFHALENATWVRVSIDAGTEETYCSIRQVSKQHFVKMQDNVRRLVALKKKLNSPMVIGVGFVVTKENYAEILQGVNLAKELGADNIRLSAIFTGNDFDYFKDFHQAAADLCKMAERASDSKFTVYNNFGSRIADLQQHAPDYSYCGYQRITTYIGGDLNVYRCCVTSYNQQGLLGSIKETRFFDFWNSPEVIAEFENFDARSCDRCMFNNQNRFINYAMEKNPLHVNFT